MSLTEDAVLRLKRDYPSIAVVAREGSAPQLIRWRLHLNRYPEVGFRVPESSAVVMAVRVRIEGIRGGRSRVRCLYELIIDTSSLARGIPPVWVASPPDHEIKHVNIWPAHKSFCRWTGTQLPSICWNTFATAWSAAPLRSRTLGAALEYARQLLNTENHDSPAR